MLAPAEFEKWLKVISNLRVDRKQNIAPHKPLLLLVVADLADERKLTEPILLLSGELVFRFLAFWTVVAKRRSQRPDIRLPFFHLCNDGCWTPLNGEGQPTRERSLVSAARIDERFLDCLNNHTFLQQMRKILIAKYFLEPTERAALYALVKLPVPEGDVVKADAQRYNESRELGRDARFRLTVVPAYNYTCALTGYRCVTIDSGSIVDAAHIHQFAKSHNNDPQNGITLSKNAHWLFDQGLWSLTDDYEVIVASSRFDESGDEAFLLNRVAGKKIRLPADRSFWPDRSHMAWHRNNRFSHP